MIFVHENGQLATWIMREIASALALCEFRILPGREIFQSQRAWNLELPGDARGGRARDLSGGAKSDRLFGCGRNAVQKLIQKIIHEGIVRVELLLLIEERLQMSAVSQLGVRIGVTAGH